MQLQIWRLNNFEKGKILQKEMSDIRFWCQHEKQGIGFVTRSPVSNIESN